MARMTGGGALVEMLRRNQVDTIFALPGVQNDALFVAFYDAGEALRVIHTRHEQGAAYMAFGYARATGKVGAYAVVPGPGMLNTTAALATAYATNAPVLCISGQVASDLIGRGFGLLHEIPDQLGILERLTKWAARIEHPTQTGRLVNEAFRQLCEGRPRPVGLEIPPDVLALATEVLLPAVESLPEIAAPDPELIDKAATLLADAKKPLFFVGSGAVGATEEVLAIAEMLEAPVVSFTGGKGIVGDRHYLAQSALAGHELWRETDVVLAVGTRLHQPQVRWGVDRDLKLIRIDVDPLEITRIQRPALGIVAGAKPALGALHRALEHRASKRHSRKDELEALKSRTHASLTDKLGPQCEYLKVIRAELPDDGIYVEDLTQVGYVGRMAFPVYHPRTYIHSGYQGTLGFGFATALGAKVGRPDRSVVSVSGDGGFMYNVQELSTAVKHGIDIVAIVFADGAFGNVRRMQKEDYGNRLIGVDLLNPQFPKMAESFGAAGVRTTTPEGLGRELAAALKRRGTTLIEVSVGEMPDPWKVMLPPRVRGGVDSPGPMFDKTKLEALRAKYTGAKETEVAPAEFRKPLSLVFGENYRRAMPYAGLSTLLDRPYRPEAPDLPDFGGLDVALVGVPMDLGVTNRAGARFGPRAVRDVERIGPYNHALRVIPRGECNAADIGDVPMRSRFSLDASIEDIAAFYGRIQEAGVRPLSVGGDHSITYPILQGLGRERPVGLVHIDAHCDTMGELEDTKFHHGGPFRQAVLAGVLDPERTIQIGIRGPAELFWGFSYESGMTVLHIEDVDRLGIAGVVEKARAVVGDGPTYISFDVDGLDPAYAPGTGTPEAGGLTPREAQSILHGLAGIDIVGGDVVEVAPQYDPTSNTAMVGAQILFEIFSLTVLGPRFKRSAA